MIGGFVCHIAAKVHRLADGNAHLNSILHHADLGFVELHDDKFVQAIAATVGLMLVKPIQPHHRALGDRLGDAPFLHAADARAVRDSRRRLDARGSYAPRGFGGNAADAVKREVLRLAQPGYQHPLGRDFP